MAKERKINNKFEENNESLLVNLHWIVSPDFASKFEKKIKETNDYEKHYIKSVAITPKSINVGKNKYSFDVRWSVTKPIETSDRLIDQLIVNKNEIVKFTDWDKFLKSEGCIYKETVDLFEKGKTVVVEANDVKLKSVDTKKFLDVLALKNKTQNGNFTIKDVVKTASDMEKFEKFEKELINNERKKYKVIERER